ncbi:hypothetical protein GC101_14825 [Paenibacillus sp. LMG 31459]|uniref:Uncharacterized protein n=1 Tax=Paenibacillus phytohabitans TaxID=2654978 RepID=A0ABX1YH35_9BACL|nr:hypothetical protein [Paenibacillus phytohabitans]
MGLKNVTITQQKTALKATNKALQQLRSVLTGGSRWIELEMIPMDVVHNCGEYLDFRLLLSVDFLIVTAFSGRNPVTKAVAGAPTVPKSPPLFSSVIVFFSSIYRSLIYSTIKADLEILTHT